MSLKKKVISGGLSVAGIREIQKQLREYQNSIDYKMELIEERLAEVGIKIAYESSVGDSHKFSEMVTFSMEWQGKTLYLVGKNSNTAGLHIEWYDGKGEYHDETISPILALEWGTAGFAIKGHQGDAAVTENHVNDTEWLYYSDVDKNKNPINPKKATAEEPHEPMYKASLAMQKIITKTVKEVFSSVS